MILALDIGNTNIMLGCVDENGVRFTGRLSTDRNKTEEEYAIMLKSVMDLFGADMGGVEGAIISSVVPPLSGILAKAVKLVTGKNALTVGPGVKTGLNIKIDNPAQLGSDMVAGAVAAIAEYAAPILIFDMGTATTVSVIDKKQNFLGGMLLPGVTISQEALSVRTAQLPRISLETPGRMIGRNTVECMQSGIIYGNAAMLDGIAERIEDELRGKTTVVATGGLARSIIPYCRHKILYDENLLLKGLRIIYVKNA